MRDIVLIAHNLRSTHNIGSLLRTADGIGVKEVYLTGYTPYPQQTNDDRLPYLAEKIDRAIHKTALDAEKTVSWHHSSDVDTVLKQLEQAGYKLVVLEQSKTAQNLHEFNHAGPVALLIGNEVEGVDAQLLKRIPTHLFIPMFGKKESFNVVQAAAMALYQLRFY